MHGIVAPIIAVVNPFVPATVRQSTGFTTAPDGSTTPTYIEFAISAQVQALTYTDIAHTNGLNIEGVRRAMYLTGNVMALVRARQRGGDLIIFPAGTLPEGDTWLAALILEQWPEWVKVCLTLQTDS